MELWLIVGLLFSISIFQTVHDYASIGWNRTPRNGSPAMLVKGYILALTYLIGWLAEVWAWSILIFMVIGYIYFHCI